MNMSSAVCLVAIGRKYISTAVPLLDYLACAGARCLALTDDPGAFSFGVETLLPPDSSHPWHQKRHVLRRALLGSETAYCMDADMQLLTSSHSPSIPVLQPAGLHVSQVINLLEHQSAWRADARVPIYHRACAEMGIAEAVARPHLSFCYESVFAISRGENCDSFFNYWDRYANWLNRTGQITTDGVALGLCSYLSGFPIHSPAQFAGLANCQHLASGSWRSNLNGTGLP